MKNPRSERIASTALAYLIVGVLALSEPAFPQSALPTSVLDCSVMIKLRGMTGSGFLVQDSAHWCLVTARHVLFTDTIIKDSHGRMLRGYRPLDTRATVTGYTAGQPFEYAVNLDTLWSDGFLKADTLHDVAVACLGQAITGPDTQGFIENPRYVTRTKGQGVPITMNWWRVLRRYEQIIVGNDVFVFGYPVSIGLRRMPPPLQQIDYDRPLVHKGVVAGLNPARKTIVIDVAANQGNSGGPVIEIEAPDKSGVSKTVPIGVVSEYIPLEEEQLNVTRGWRYSTITSSPYSVVEPLDPVIDIIQGWK